MVLLYWIPGVLVLLVTAVLVTWWRHEGLTWPFVIVTALFFVTIVLPILIVYVLLWQHDWRVRPG